MWVVSITIPPSAVLILAILGRQSAQFSKEDVSVVVHPPSQIINLDSGSLFRSDSEPTAASSYFFVIARDSFSEMMMSVSPRKSNDFLDDSDSTS